MKYLKQFGLILLVSFCGEALSYLIPLPIPASIYGLVLMLAALGTKRIPLSAVRETGKFLIEIMPIMFIPAAVGLVRYWYVLRPIFVPVAVITLVSTVVVMAGTGRITQAVIRLSERRKRNAGDAR
ncbi:MAG TPA: CidA/LrgA family protein [Oscillospiraceae bacterium]|nr:CidA/LrgA family protein [Oscillospiraceae bacterium]